MRDAIDLYGPGGNLALMCIITNPAVDMIPAMLAMNDEVIKYETGYYCA